MLFLLIGCGAEQTTVKSDAATIGIEAFLAKYEPGFNPSAYRPNLLQVATAEEQRLASLTSVAVFTPVAQETIPGVRIQVLMTKEIEQARGLFDGLTVSLPDQWVYLVYDAPYYKIRIGNFVDRPSAGVLLQELLHTGYKDSWIVPDKVLRNPPPKLPEGFIVPSPPIERNR